MTMRVALDSIGLPTSALRTADCELIRFRFPIENPNPHVHKDRQPGARGQAPDTANPAVSRSQLLGFKQTDPDFLGDDAADQSKLNLLLINTIIILLHPILTTMSLTVARERRSWTAKEDQLLRDAVHKGLSSLYSLNSPLTHHTEDPDNANPSKWHAIAKHVPNRTNKDCRKRWFAKMANDVVKGGWSPQEDEKLVKGIERYGTRYVPSLISPPLLILILLLQLVPRRLRRSVKEQ